MSILKRNKPSGNPSSQANLAEVALKNINDGVMITDKSGTIQFVNPAGVKMIECGSADKAIGLDYGLFLKLETKEGRELPESENLVIQAMKSKQPLEGFQACLISQHSDKRIPISISVLPVDGIGQNHIITFRNISKELAEEGEQTEFISTASHEMRTPVATIDGYLSLALNPQTATIDERARGYLTAAEKASKHLGKLFQDLLDVTKLDDGRIRPHFEPVEMVGLVKTIADDYISRAKEAKLTFAFGSSEQSTFNLGHQLDQVVYGYVDTNFMREILDNLIENAIKYTPSGGSIYVNARGDGDRVLINVTDTGIGISADDLGHIFQKFYRADNSDTRTIGGTGLGLYLVKQRVEAMGGHIWAESAFGEGSTFFVSLPRITADEYEKRMIAVRNQQMNQQMQNQGNNPTPQTVTQTAPATPQQNITATQQIISPIQPVEPIVQQHPEQPTQPQPKSPMNDPPAPPDPIGSPTAAAQTPPQVSPQIQNNNNLNGVQQ